MMLLVEPEATWQAGRQTWKTPRRIQNAGLSDCGVQRLMTWRQHTEH